MSVLPKGVTTIREYFERKNARKAKRDEKAVALWTHKAGRPKKVSLWKLWRDKCDELWSLVVRRRDQRAFGRCRICKTGPIQVGYHIVPRTRLATRWDLDNGVGACTNCNRGEQMNRLTYQDKHRELFGLAYEHLLEKSRQKVKFSADDLKALATTLRAQIELA